MKYDIQDIPKGAKITAPTPGYAHYVAYLVLEDVPGFENCSVQVQHRIVTIIAHGPCDAWTTLYRVLEDA